MTRWLFEKMGFEVTFKGIKRTKTEKTIGQLYKYQK